MKEVLFQCLIQTVRYVRNIKKSKTIEHRSTEHKPINQSVSQAVNQFKIYIMKYIGFNY